MAGWKQSLAQMMTRLEARFDSLKQRLRWRARREGLLQIVPYIGHGTPTTLYLKGRLLQDKHISKPTDQDTLWQNLRNMYKRFASNEVPQTRLVARFGLLTQEIITDEEGFFDLCWQLGQPLEEGKIWHEVVFNLPNSDISAAGRVMIPPANAQFGVISDIDDTVVQTSAFNTLKMARNVFLSNAHTRLPFEGVAAFYQALQKGAGSVYNPLFYLSGSVWNLYDLLVDFFELRGIPAGPLFLMNLGLAERQLFSPNHYEHKLSTLQLLLDTYPALPFILIGDSGQQDPEIYTQSTADNPGRILAIYIRDVTGEGRAAEIQKLAELTQKFKTELVLVKDTAAAALHAVECGFIHHDTLPNIFRANHRDTQPPHFNRQMLD